MAPVPGGAGAISEGMIYMIKGSDLSSPVEVGEMKNWMIGADVSTLLEVERCGGRFYDGGPAEDALVILKRYGVNTLRLRLWNDPYPLPGSPTAPETVTWTA